MDQLLPWVTFSFLQDTNVNAFNSKGLNKLTGDGRMGSGHLVGKQGEVPGHVSTSDSLFPRLSWHTRLEPKTELTPLVGDNEPFRLLAGEFPWLH